MTKLNKENIKQLKSMAHNLKPLVQIGQKGVTDTLIGAISEALEDHELIKLKFMAFKDEKSEIVDDIVSKTGAELVSVIGNIAILFKVSTKEDKRVISKRAKI